MRNIPCLVFRVREKTKTSGQPRRVCVFFISIIGGIFFPFKLEGNSTLGHSCTATVYW